MKDIECMKILPRNLNGTFGRIWEDDIKMVLKDIGCTLVDWINLAKNKVQWRVVVNTVMYLRGPQKAGNFLTS